MDSLSVLCILIGVLIVAVRGPLIFAPSATLRFFDRLIATDVRIRRLGFVLAPLALAFVILPGGETWVAEVLRAVGWLFAAATLWLLIAPASYRRIARGVLDFFEHSVDEAIVRVVGLVAVALGVAMIYIGISVV